LLVIKRQTTTDRRAPKYRTWRFSLPLLYAAVVLCSIGIYIYRDTRSVDAHLSRANHDRIHDEMGKTIQEYEAALALEDNPHTHKLLAIELAEAGYWTDAISEFRLA